MNPTYVTIAMDGQLPALALGQDQASVTLTGFKPCGSFGLFVKEIDELHLVVSVEGTTPVNIFKQEAGDSLNYFRTIHPGRAEVISKRDGDLTFSFLTIPVNGKLPQLVNFKVVQLQPGYLTFHFL